MNVSNKGQSVAKLQNDAYSRSITFALRIQILLLKPILKDNFHNLILGIDKGIILDIIGSGGGGETFKIP
jgi:hypothetical protein